jgi:hypothetical protein
VADVVRNRRAFRLRAPLARLSTITAPLSTSEKTGGLAPSGIPLDAAFLNLIAKHSNDMPGKVLFDLSGLRNRLRDSRVGVAIPIVLRAISNQYTSGPFDLLDQVDAFHDTTKSSTRRAPGISPADKSA